jgi:hypothetical protein
MMRRLKTRVAAWSACALAAAAVVLLAALPIVSKFRAQEARVAGLVQQLSMMRARAATLPQRQGELAEMERSAGSLPGLLAGEDAASAAAQIQSAVKAIVERQRGEVRTSQVGEPQTVHGFEQVAVQFQVAIPITTLRDVLYAVETHVPYFFIEDLTISGPRPWPREEPLTVEPRLNIDWALIAYRRSAAP